MKTIHFISYNTHEPLLQQYFKTQEDFELVEFDMKNINEVEYLLITKPLNSNNNYISVSKIWWRWLRINYPNVILLVAGFAENQKDKTTGKELCNYIDFLNLKSNFKENIKNARKVSEFKVNLIEKNGQKIYIETWWSIELSRGFDIEVRLKKFFDGHNNKSLAKHLTAIRHTFMLVYDELKSTYQDKFSYQDLLRDFIEKYGRKEWQRLYSRWQNYSVDFPYLPFTSIIEEIHPAIEEINSFFNTPPKDETEFMKLECHKKLHHIYRLLEQEIKPYVYIDDYYLLKTKG